MLIQEKFSAPCVVCPHLLSVPVEMFLSCVRVDARGTRSPAEVKSDPLASQCVAHSSTDGGMRVWFALSNVQCEAFAMITAALCIQCLVRGSDLLASPQA